MVVEWKLGMYAYYIISMTITCFHDDHILFEKASGNFLLNLLLNGFLGWICWANGSLESKRLVWKAIYLYLASGMHYKASVRLLAAYLQACGTNQVW